MRLDFSSSFRIIFWMLLWSRQLLYCSGFVRKSANFRKGTVSGVKASFQRPIFQSLKMSTTSAAVSKKYILEYHYVENMVERRAPYRADHLSNAERLLQDNILIAGGAFMPNADGALFIFSSDYETVENFVQNDPYFKAGLIPKYSIREWNVVVGKL